MTDCFLSDDRLAAYADGTLAAEDRTGVEQHLAGCDRCTARLAWLRMLAAQAAALPRTIEPGRDLWTGIEGRMAREGQTRNRRIRWPLLAAAAVALIVVSSAITIALSHRGPAAPIATTGHRPIEVPAGANPDAIALAALMAQVKALEAALPAETRALVANQLRQVDAAIEESKVALSSGKSTNLVLNMLAARYQQRLDLLEQAEHLARRS